MVLNHQEEMIYKVGFTVFITFFWKPTLAGNKGRNSQVKVLKDNGSENIK